MRTGRFLAGLFQPAAALRSMNEFAAARPRTGRRRPTAERLLAHIKIYAGEFNSASADLEALMDDWGHLREGHGLSRFQVDLPAGIRFSRAFCLGYKVILIVPPGWQAIDRAADLDHMISWSNAISLAAASDRFRGG